MHSVAFDVHPEDCRRDIGCLIGILGELDSTGLATPTGLDLGFNDHLAANLAGDLTGGVGR